MKKYHEKISVPYHFHSNPGIMRIRKPTSCAWCGRERDFNFNYLHVGSIHYNKNLKYIIATPNK